MTDTPVRLSFSAPHVLARETLRAAGLSADGGLADLNAARLARWAMTLDALDAIRPDRFSPAWHAARRVVDTSPRAKGWHHEQAQRYLNDNTARADHEIETEVNRLIAAGGKSPNSDEESA